MISGVYEIVCRPTRQRYIGQSLNVRDRFNGHRSELRHGIHPNPRLQAAWNAYGESEFDFNVIAEVPSDQLLDAERVYMTKFRAVEPDFGFNVRKPSSPKPAA